MQTLEIEKHGEIKCSGFPLLSLIRLISGPYLSRASFTQSVLMASQLNWFCSVKCDHSANCIVPNASCECCKSTDQSNHQQWSNATSNHHIHQHNWTQSRTTDSEERELDRSLATISQTVTQQPVRWGQQADNRR